MARTHARILTSIWNDDSDFVNLDADQQRTFFVLLSQGELSPCGVLTYSPKRLARLARNTPLRKITTAVTGLEAARYIVLDHDTDELTFRTFLRHDGVLAHPNALKGAARSFSTIHSRLIRNAVVDQLPPAVRAMWPAGVITASPKALGAILTGEPSDQPSVEGSHQPSAQPSPEPSVPRTRARGAQARAVPAPAPAPPPLPRPQPPEPPAPATRRNGSTDHEQAAAAAEEEEDPRIRQACGILADRALAARTGPPITDRRAWLTRVTHERWADHADHAAQLLDLEPALTPPELADLLEPDLDHPPDADAGLEPDDTELEARRLRAEALATHGTPQHHAAVADARATLQALKRNR